MASPKSMASLSSSLLARKGTAKPAMRPQGFVGLSHHNSHEDLGWNDMGDEAAAQSDPAPQFAPAPKPVPAAQPVEKPVVLRQIEAIEKQISQPVAPAPKPKPPVPSAAVRVARGSSARTTKAAFTLRLDTDRHLRLRLASAVTHRSAQQLVTEALDAFLDSQPEVEALARQIGTGKDHG